MTTDNPACGEELVVGLWEEHLTDEDFSKLSAFIHAEYGIHLPPVKKSLLEGRLRKRMRRMGIPSFKQYCKYLFTDRGMAEELSHMIDAVTTNKTDFFREPAHFSYVVGTALPALLGGMKPGDEKKIIAWSAACSSGEEPYTLAMVLSECAGQCGGFDFIVLATDICTQVLAAAEAGIYDEEKVVPIPVEMRRKYLLRSRDPSRRVVRVAPEVRAKVRCQRMNLVDRSYPLPEGIHMIFCRNVLIYFDAETQQRLVRQFCRHLAPGGYLFMGHSETLKNLDVSLRYVAPTIYRKVAS